ncbi:SDR family NAD(P)-dependent oxidoreductase [Brevibacillus invocatus]|nr:SDR family NAD(P)-dependent oxidoreductase [Brevibacillus invocatus]MCM3432128.1 SDR family NAD(P)-dependent oxidoreductase [Brevibacillus invocatus]
MHVWVADLYEYSASRVVAEIRENGNQATAYRLDVSDPEGVARFFESVDQACGRVDILVLLSARGVEANDERSLWARHQYVLSGG